MDDKQIIINGVDVAGCYFYYKGECRCEQNCIDDDKGETIEELFYREPEHNKWECELSKNCYYKQLKAKEQECDELKKQLERKEENYQKFLSKSNKYIHNLVDENVQDISNLARQLEQLKTENEKMSKGYSKLTEIVSPYMNDFTGYNEELGGFDLILCVKELLEEAERQYQADKGLITSTGKMNYQLIQEYDKLKNCLTEIKEIAQYDVYTSRTDLCLKLNWIKKKISECEVEK